MSTSIQETNSFPEDIFCPSSDTQDSQQDELLYNHNPFTTTTNESSNSFQQMIQKTFDFASIVAHETDIQNDILQWEQRLKAESSKSKALRLKQLKYNHRSGSNGNKAKTKKKKGLSKEVVNLLEVMENDAEVEVGRLDQWQQQQQQQGWSLASGSATTNEQHNNNKEEEEETQTKHYKDSLYRLGILETKITTHEAAIRKCTRPSIRLSVGGGGGEHHDNNKKQQAKQLELQHHKLELAKAEGEMIEMRKIADAQLRGLFLMKLCKELEVQEEAARRKEADVKKWEIILKKAQEGCL